MLDRPDLASQLTTLQPEPQFLVSSRNLRTSHVHSLLGLSTFAMVSTLAQTRGTAYAIFGKNISSPPRRRRTHCLLLPSLLLACFNLAQRFTTSSEQGPQETAPLFLKVRQALPFSKRDTTGIIPCSTLSLQFSLAEMHMAPLSEPCRKGLDPM